MRGTWIFRQLAAVALAAVVGVGGAKTAQAQASDNADVAEINRYRLTEAKLDKFVQATRNLAEAARQHPELAKEEKNDNNNKTLTQMAALYDKHPPIKRAITSAGMTSREYITFMFAMLQAGMASWASKQPGAKLPPDISRENIAFVDTHKEKLDALQKEFQAMEKKGSSDSADEEESEEEEEAEQDSTPALR
jgi:hypothetical protein